VAQNGSGLTWFVRGASSAILRFLIGHGFKLLFSRNEAEAAAWTKLTTQADNRANEIVTELLSRRK
jgi:hypothetical protein